MKPNTDPRSASHRGILTSYATQRLGREDLVGKLVSFYYCYLGDKVWIGSIFYENEFIDYSLGLSAVRQVEEIHRVEVSSEAAILETPVDLDGNLITEGAAVIYVKNRDAGSLSKGVVEEIKANIAAIRDNKDGCLYERSILSEVGVMPRE